VSNFFRPQQKGGRFLSETTFFSYISDLVGGRNRPKLLFDTMVYRQTAEKLGGITPKSDGRGS
jgi:hypothetical protein